MKCRICDSDDLRVLYKMGTHDQFVFHQCRNCRLVNLDLQSINIVENQEKYSTEQFVRPADFEKEKGVSNSYHFIKRHVPGKGRFLDIGCGNGALLYFAKKDGWEIKGLELSPLLAGYVREKLGCEVDVYDFMQFNGKGQRFDLVSLRHVLEHLPDSLLAMNKISALLNTSGYALFEFPNIYSIAHRFQRVKNRIKPLKKKYKDSFVPAHCNEFSKTAFHHLLNKTGFRLIRWETYSAKPVSNFIYNHWPIGTNARAIVQKVSVR